jgi:hypothetical protein
MSAGVEVRKVALCRSYIEMTQPATHMFDRGRRTPVCLIPFKQRDGCTVA